MSSLMSIQGAEMRIVNYVYNNSIKKFAGSKVKKFANELAEVGLIALLEFVKENHINLENYVFEDKLQNTVANAMQRELAKLKQDKPISLSKEAKNKEDSTLEDFIPDTTTYFDYFDLEFLKQQIFNILALYSQNEQKILQAYFFENEDNKTVFCKNFNIKYSDLRDLVRDYRKKLKFKLQIEGYTDIEQYSLSNDEFTLKKWYIAEKERKKLAKQGIQVFNIGDFKIYKLIRENGNIKQYATCLNIHIDDLEKIIYHKLSQRKLFLYQIQALRQKFFNEYTLAELTECEAVCCT